MLLTVPASSMDHSSRKWLIHGLFQAGFLCLLHTQAFSQPLAKENPLQPPPPPAASNDRAFDLPQLDDRAIAASGLRKISGQHISIYTDLPPAEEIEQLPRAFDAAVPLWCEYFSFPRERVTNWKLVACLMKAKERFTGVGLYPSKLPEFANGYNIGSQIWVYEQPSAYYRRHLLLHEGTHAFMLRWLGGAGPPWYMEGMAELLATHRWQNGQLTLPIMPANREQVLYWGRIKMIKDDEAAGKGRSLLDVMKYDARAHLQVEAYAWCWAAAWFFDHHPETHDAFRALQQAASDRSPGFSRRFYERLKSDWPAIATDWQLFAKECDYGYDVPRAAVIRKPMVDLPAEGAVVTLATDHGWQSTGYRLAADKKYEIKARGRYTIAAKPQTVPCEAGGITLHYHRSLPLGILLAAVENDGPGNEATSLLKPQMIGLANQINSPTGGGLFLKINEAPSGLADNSGSLQISIRELK